MIDGCTGGCASEPTSIGALRIGSFKMKSVALRHVGHTLVLIKIILIQIKTYARPVKCYFPCSDVNKILGSNKSYKCFIMVESSVKLYLNVIKYINVVE